MSQYIRHAVGKLGEDVACKYLEGRNYRIIERNYRKKWGEIDIVAEKDRVLFFIEVKSVSRETGNYNSPTDNIRPEENIHHQKLKRLGRAIKTYLLERKVPFETVWRLDGLMVFLDRERSTARIQRIENIIIEE